MQRPVRAVLEFLEPIDAELPKAELLAVMTQAGETRIAELIGEARGG